MSFLISYIWSYIPYLTWSSDALDNNSSDISSDISSNNNSSDISSDISSNNNSDGIDNRCDSIDNRSDIFLCPTCRKKYKTLFCWQKHREEKHGIKFSQQEKVDNIENIHGEILQR